jgi:Arc/MetJ-type ribon-helix-helix transcriptional regulator
MITNEALERVRGWFTGRVPEEWQAEPVTVVVDREEIIVGLTLPDVDLPEGTSAAEADEARAGRAKAFREDTRGRRMSIAGEAERRFDRKVSWQVTIGDRTELFTHVAAPVMTRLRQPQRQVLDTLVDAGVARSRSEALAWCVRLVEQHQDDWLGELRQAMTAVADVRAKGPAA